MSLRDNLQFLPHALGEEDTLAKEKVQPVPSWEQLKNKESSSNIYFFIPSLPSFTMGYMNIKMHTITGKL